MIIGTDPALQGRRPVRPAGAARGAGGRKEGPPAGKPKGWKAGSRFGRMLDAEMEKIKAAGSR